VRFSIFFPLGARRLDEGDRSSGVSRPASSPGHSGKSPGCARYASHASRHCDCRAGRRCPCRRASGIARPRRPRATGTARPNGCARRNAPPPARRARAWAWRHEGARRQEWRLRRRRLPRPSSAAPRGSPFALGADHRHQRPPAPRLRPQREPHIAIGGHRLSGPAVRRMAEKFAEHSIEGERLRPHRLAHQRAGIRRGAACARSRRFRHAHLFHRQPFDRHALIAWSRGERKEQNRNIVHHWPCGPIRTT